MSDMDAGDSGYETGYYADDDVGYYSADDAGYKTLCLPQ
jgi:hypothetical protein